MIYFHLMWSYYQQLTPPQCLQSLARSRHSPKLILLLDALKGLSPVAVSTSRRISCLDALFKGLIIGLGGHRDCKLFVCVLSCSHPRRGTVRRAWCAWCSQDPTHRSWNCTEGQAWLQGPCNLAYRFKNLLFQFYLQALSRCQGPLCEDLNPLCSLTSLCC